MKIGVIGDIHWCKYSSIVRSRGEKYSTRLENCIKSISWAEWELYEHDCDCIIYLGDFFDMSSINAEEISALNEIHWAPVKHYLLVGNHEMGIHDLSFNSAHIFNLSNFKVVDSCTSFIDDIGTEICFVPYTLNNTYSISELFPVKSHKRVIFSHNDIAGIQMGKFISKEGFSIEDIEQNCDLFINGHLHNGERISSKIYNVGNLTGQNFSEDGLKYSHNIFILDTETLEFNNITNPHALNFYKFDDVKDLYIHKIENGVLTIKVDESEVKEIRNYLDNNDNIIAYRVLVNPETTETSSIQHIDIAINHLEKFKEFILDSLGTSDIITDEILKVVR